MFISLSRKYGMSEWSAQQWDPNDLVWRGYSSIHKCPVSAFPLCMKLNWKTYYFDKSWVQDEVTETENSVTFSTSRPFKHKAQDRVLKLGETRELRAGFLIGTWDKGNWGYTPTMKICLSDDGDCGQWESLDDGATPTTPTSKKWVGLDKTTCPKGSPCYGYSAEGTYDVKDSNNNSAGKKLVVTGELAWDAGNRNIDKGFGLMLAMNTANDESEWSANSWDPNGDQWSYFASSNGCSLRDTKECAKNPDKFKFD